MRKNCKEEKEYYGEEEGSKGEGGWDEGVAGELNRK